MDTGQWLTVLSVQAGLRAGARRLISRCCRTETSIQQPQPGTAAAGNMSSGETGTGDPATPARGGAQSLGYHSQNKVDMTKL